MPDAPANLRSRFAATIRNGLLAVPVGLLAGAASAVFLALLDRTVALQQAHAWLLYLLPVGGLGVVWTYRNLGGAAGRGTDLLIEQVHAGTCEVPRRMTPLVLAGTLASHLFGASVGREGTAVQMGGGLASAVIRRLGPGGDAAPALLAAGMAGGFGSVFGTPFAGAIFAMELPTVGRLRARWLVPTLVASLVAHETCLLLGAHHADYAISGATATDVALLGKVGLAALAFGLAARAYAGLAQGMSVSLQRLCPSPYARVALGGIVVIGLVHLAGNRDALGLGVASPEPGVATIASAFAPGGAGNWSWVWKLVLTALCLAAGFRGGEVTPLFFIGATLGNALAGPLGAPVDLLAGLGLVAVFAGAANTPLTCVVMGIELFGAAQALPVALACLVAFAVSGREGIYRAQRRPA